MERFDNGIASIGAFTNALTDACVSASAPLDTLDIGQPWSRWPGEPNFENGKLVCPVSTLIRSFGLPSFRTAPSARRVAAQPTGSKKKSGFRGDRSGGHFFDRGPVGQFSLDIGHSYSRFFATIGRVAKSTACSNFSFREPMKKVPLFDVCLRAVQFAQNIVAKLTENWCWNGAKIFNLMANVCVLEYTIIERNFISRKF